MVPRFGCPLRMLFGAAQPMNGGLRFSKVQSIGNDFVLVHLDEVNPAELPELARQLCDRHFSIGGDGLLAISPQDGDILLRMFNSDGSEDFCGNGLRCAAVYALRQGWTGRS